MNLNLAHSDFWDQNDPKFVRLGIKHYGNYPGSGQSPKDYHNKEYSRRLRLFVTGSEADSIQYNPRSIPTEAWQRALGAMLRTQATKPSAIPMTPCELSQVTITALAMALRFRSSRYTRRSILYLDHSLLLFSLH